MSFGSQASKSQPNRPEVVQFYNKYYHAVDTFNQAILWYQFPHRTTPKKTLLWYYLHMVLENIQIIYNFYNSPSSNKCISKQDCIKKIVQFLIKT